VGAARIENGKIDISRIEQSGALVIDISDNAPFDAGCGTNGTLSSHMRDNANCETSSPDVIANKLVLMFKVMNSLKGDKNFILTGGVTDGSNGEAILEHISLILDKEGNKDSFKVYPSGVDKTYGGAVGAAQLSMKRSDMDILGIVHDVNMSLVPQTKNTIHYVIDENLVPLSMRNEVRIFLDRFYKKYPFIGEKEKIAIVSHGNLLKRIEELSGRGGDGHINAAVSHKNIINSLPEGVKALVFSGVKEESEFVNLEGIIASLRALHQENVQSLLELFELLTGEDSDTGKFYDNDLSQLLSDPERLSKILVFHLRPMIDLTDMIDLKRTLYRYIEESA
jgi:hypothetical protein